MQEIDWKAVLASAMRDAPDDSAIGLRSAAAEWLELPKLTRWSKGEVEASWTVDPRSLNSRGTVFGGYYGVLADSLLALATMTVLEGSEHFVTSDLRLSFFRRLSGGVMSMQGRVINRSRRLVHVEGTFFDENARLLARADGVQAIVPVSQPAE